MELSPREQILSSVSGAGLTALAMTPFDVVKVRSQMPRPKQAPIMVNYCNGLMDHIICCRELTKTVRTRNCISGGGCNLPMSTYVRPAKSCVNVTRCISTQECARMTTIFKNEPKRPWYTRCPVSERNTFRTMVELARTEGVGTLWSGLPATMVMALPSTVMYFTAYEYLKIQYEYLLGQYLRPRNANDMSNALMASFAAGCSARFCSVTAIAPLELMRTKMQADGLSFREVRRQTAAAFKSKGISSLFLGYPATILRDVPFSGIYFAAYRLNTILLEGYGATSPVVTNAVSAGAAAAIAGLLTLPFDVLKTRQQMLLGSELTSRKLTISATYATVVRAEGHVALAAGAMPRLLKVVPACALMMSSYEYCKAYFLAQKSH